MPSDGPITFEVVEDLEHFTCTLRGLRFADFVERSGAQAIGAVVHAGLWAALLGIASSPGVVMRPFFYLLVLGGPVGLLGAPSP